MKAWLAVLSASLLLLVADRDCIRARTAAKAETHAAPAATHSAFNTHLHSG
jgi:hypothetical protein